MQRVDSGGIRVHKKRYHRRSPDGQLCFHNGKSNKGGRGSSQKIHAKGVGLGCGLTFSRSVPHRTNKEMGEARVKFNTVVPRGRGTKIGQTPGV